MSELEQRCEEMARRAKAAARHLAGAAPAKKDDFLRRLAGRLGANAEAIFAANAKDVAAAPEHGLTAAQVDRLRLTAGRIAAIADGARDVAALPEPVGRAIDSTVRPNGLRVDKISVPLGVIFFLFESRPNVTIDAAALAVKSGNAIILRGGKEARHSNTALHAMVTEALIDSGLPADAVQLVETIDRAAVGHLLRLPQYIDVVIPRGGESLISRVAAEARMPVMKHYRGNCHVYVDASADLAMANRIIVNAKCQRPGVCNAAETLLVHKNIAAEFLPAAAAELVANGVELRGCTLSQAIVPHAKLATDADYAEEFLDLILAVRVVPDIDTAIDHIHRFGSGHTEVIVTRDLISSRRFTAEVDAAAVMVNASTRFHDGFEFGLGAEIGISTDKFHARGPCGLRELTSYKYIVTGDGQIRD